jgi:hypothetical protein
MVHMLSVGGLTGIGSAITTGLTAAAQGVLSLVGFTSAGIGAGSAAAAVQGSAVAAGSTFATLQSVGATSALLSAPVLVPIALIGGIVGLVWALKK